jgi:hypothetical protein
VADVLAHHARHAERRGEPVPPPPTPGYDPQSLSVLFGGPCDELLLANANLSAHNKSLNAAIRHAQLLE